MTTTLRSEPKRALMVYRAIYDLVLKHNNFTVEQVRDRTKLTQQEIIRAIKTIHRVIEGERLDVPTSSGGPARGRFFWRTRGNRWDLYT